MVSAVAGAPPELAPPPPPPETAPPRLPCTAPIHAPRSPGFLTVALIARSEAPAGQLMMTSSHVVPRVGSPK